jgi:hypothetical protein
VVIIGIQTAVNSVTLLPLRLLLCCSLMLLFRVVYFFVAFDRPLVHLSPARQSFLRWLAHSGTLFPPPPLGQPTESTPPPRTLSWSRYTRSKDKDSWPARRTIVLIFCYYFPFEVKFGLTGVQSDAPFYDLIFRQPNIQTIVSNHLSYISQVDPGSLSLHYLCTAVT